MPMTLHLEYDGKEVGNYKPDEKQWWITSFNPEYENIKETDLTATFEIDFSHNKGMFDAFYKEHHRSKGWIFDTESHTATYKF